MIFFTFSRALLRVAEENQGVKCQGQSLGDKESFTSTPLWHCRYPTAVTPINTCPNFNFPWCLKQGLEYCYLLAAIT